MRSIVTHTIDEYVAHFPENIQKELNTLRETIKKAAPEAKETISYGMPAFKLNSRILVYFAAAKNHIGFYPTASPIVAFKKDLGSYETSKGTIKFPLDKPVPTKLVERIVKFKAQEILNQKKH